MSSTTFPPRSSRRWSSWHRFRARAGSTASAWFARAAAVRAYGSLVAPGSRAAAPPERLRRSDPIRRKHPLADDADGLLESIELERAMLEPTREAADLVIDTTGLNIHQLKERVVSAFSDAGSAQMQIAVESFGFKHGLPMDADIVMDVRFLPKPFCDEELG